MNPQSTPGAPTPESLIVEPAAGNAHSSFNLHPKPKRRKIILIVAGAIVAAVIAGAAGWYFGGPKPEPNQTAVKASPSPTAAPAPVTKLSPLTGVPVAPELADRSLSGVIIENHPDARPQSGLGQAGVVYETLAEGGITRFLAIFQDQRPAAMGPVRSLRPYFIDWALEFNASVAHAGGSATALSLVGPYGLKSTNALSSGSSGFYRTSDRRAPHNLYTNSDKLDALNARLGFNKPPDFVPSPRKADTPSTAPQHPNVHIEYSYNGFQVDYQYSPATNDYGRSMGGSPHVDRNTGNQIRVKNIVIEMMPTSTLPDGHVQMGTIGRGQAYIIRDGGAIACTWVKESRNGRTKLVDAAGADIPLNPGNTWYSIVPQGKKVAF